MAKLYCSLCHDAFATQEDYEDHACPAVDAYEENVLKPEYDRLQREAK